MNGTTQLKQGIALYLRVSSDDKQDPENSFEHQRQRIQSCVAQNQNDLPIIKEYSDILSGKHSKHSGYQHMLWDAYNCQFSHLAVCSIDRLGRSSEETLCNVQAIVEMGIDIIVADSPDMTLAMPGGSPLLGMRAVVAQYEADMLSQQVKDTKRSILLAGGWPAALPDGYTRIRERQGRAHAADRIIHDAERAQMWKEAWNLLLSDQYTLEQISELLHNKGYTRRSGRPWYWIHPASEKSHSAISHLSRTFHMPFYAGWVVSPSNGIERGEIRGVWEPLVSDAQFDEGLMILHTYHSTSKGGQVK